MLHPSRLLLPLLVLTSVCLQFVHAESVETQIDDQIQLPATDWPWWRGPTRDGIAHPEQDAPLRWDAETNVAWSASIPGRGHGSPIVCGDHVLLNSADELAQTQSLLCFDRNTGKRVWRCDVHANGLPPKLNGKASHASTSPAWDGESYFVTFMSHGAVYATSVDLQGRQRWQTKITDYVVHQGYGASPCLYQNLVIVAADNKQSGAVAALDRQTGKIVWKQERPNKPNYPSPIVCRIGQQDQLLLTGTDLVTSLSPLEGNKLWEISGATTECVTSTITDGKHVFTSGGYPTNHMSAVLADGSGKIVWQNRNRIYVPSLLISNGYLYGVLDAGVAGCWDAATGKQMWKHRLGGTFSASPVLVNDRIYVTNETGTTFVYQNQETEFKMLATNQLGDNVMATPAFCDHKIFMRVAFETAGQREEKLYCIVRE